MNFINTLAAINNIGDDVLKRAAAIREALIAARDRTRDESINVAVKAGRYQVQRVTFDKVGRSTVTPLTEFISAEAAISYLNAIEVAA